jgi:hypothetical protein
VDGFSDTRSIENKNDTPAWNVLQKSPKTFHDDDVEHLKIEHINRVTPPTIVVVDNPIISVTTRIFFSIQLQKIRYPAIETVPDLILIFFICRHGFAPLFPATKETKTAHDLAHVNSLVKLAYSRIDLIPIGNIVPQEYILIIKRQLPTRTCRWGLWL